jgi:hypothetical protein
VDDIGQQVCNFPTRLPKGSTQTIDVTFVEIVIQVEFKPPFRS